jgi:hypothetical protein
MKMRREKVVLWDSAAAAGAAGTRQALLRSALLCQHNFEHRCKAKANNNKSTLSFSIKHSYLTLSMLESTMTSLLPRDEVNNNPSTAFRRRINQLNNINPTKSNNPNNINLPSKANLPSNFIYADSDDDEDDSEHISVIQPFPLLVNKKPNHIAQLPLEILMDLTNFIDIPSLISLTMTNFSLTSDFHFSTEFWRCHFISRWGPEQQINNQTKLASTVNLTNKIIFNITKNSSYFWNAIEFSFSEGALFKRKQQKLREQQEKYAKLQGFSPLLQPHSDEEELKFPESLLETYGNPKLGREQLNRRANSRCSALTKPLVKSLICPRSPSNHSSAEKFPPTAETGPTSPSLALSNRISSLLTKKGSSALCNQWKSACLLRDSRGPAEVELRLCMICNELDLFTVEERELELSRGGNSHSTSQWITPCSCGTFTHRICLEKQIVSNHLTGPESGENGLEGVEQENGGIGRIGAPNNTKCAVCGSPYHITQRLPLSITELLLSTWNDRNWLLSKFLSVSIPLLIIQILLLFMLENLHLALGNAISGRKALFFDLRSESGIRYPSPLQHLFLFYHHLLCLILFSPRFHATIARIWRTPLFTFYIKLYCVMGGNVIITLCIINGVPQLQFLYNAQIAVISAVLGPVLSNFLALLNCILFFLLSTVVIFLFWKTQYRVQTLRDHTVVNPIQHNNQEVINALANNTNMPRNNHSNVNNGARSAHNGNNQNNQNVAQINVSNLFHLHQHHNALGHNHEGCLTCGLFNVQF